MSVRAVRSRRAIVAVVVTALVGAIWLVGSPRPAEASPVSLLVAGEIAMTNGPHAQGWEYESDGDPVAPPTVNTGAWTTTTSFLSIQGVLLNVSLFTAGTHLAVTSMQLHLADSGPNCLASLTGSRLLNFVGGTSYQVLSTTGAYTLSNCTVLVSAVWALAFGSSPSSAHLVIGLEIEESLAPPTTTTTTTTVPPEGELAVVGGEITATNGPHAVPWVYEGDGASVEGATLTAGPWSNVLFPFDLTAPIALFTVGSHLALSSMTFHLPDVNNPNCLVTLSTARLLNFVGGTSYQVLATMGSYSVASCGLLVTAAWALLFGASPSSAHLVIDLDIDHVEV